MIDPRMAIANTTAQGRSYRRHLACRSRDYDAGKMPVVRLQDDEGKMHALRLKNDFALSCEYRRQGSNL